MVDRYMLMNVAGEQRAMEPVVPCGKVWREMIVRMLGLETRTWARTLREACEVFVRAHKPEKMPLLVSVEWDGAGPRLYTVDFIFPEYREQVEAVKSILKEASND